MLTYNFPDHYKGDYWEGIPSIVLQNGSEFVNLSGATVRLQLKVRENTDIFALEFSTENGGITITNPLSGEISIPGQIIDIDAYKYVYDLEYTIPSMGEDYVLTTLKGTWEIVQDITE